MKIPSHVEFINYIKDYLKISGETQSKFGYRVLGDSGAMTRLIEGTDPRLSTVKKVCEAIASGVPKKVKKVKKNASRS